ncbi:UNVERIFIED_CONTAM: hypothetical protein Slati_4522600 [Sesamum latifolium]|uniref:Uncharacterized protein n=1 Tax=Sesamum latifolium TaxID=2727402 RepID=A0AAW2SGM6_9LAMI
MDYEGVSQAVRVFGRFPFAYPPHSPLVGRVVNLEGARLFFRRVLDNLAVLRSPLLGRECLVAGVSFSSTNSVVLALV